MIPDVCPVCGAKTEREKDTADIKCTSPNCPAQLERHIINFVGGTQWTSKVLVRFILKNLSVWGILIMSLMFLYLKTHRDELIDQGIIGKEKNTDKLLDAIEKSKENDAFSFSPDLEFQMSERQPQRPI